jgi:signal peptidase I
MDIPEPVDLTPTQIRSHRLAGKLLLPLLALLIAVIVPLYVLYDVAQVSGPSMKPTLLDREYLLITRGWPSPHRGDIVVLRWAHDGVTEEIVKRVVGLPGDTVSVRGDWVTVNGAPETFQHEILAADRTTPLDLTVPPGQFFFMGDNRAESFDARYIGPLPLTTIHGRVVAVWAPVTRMRVVPSP